MAHTPQREFPSIDVTPDGTCKLSSCRFLIHWLGILDLVSVVGTLCHEQMHCPEELQAEKAEDSVCKITAATDY